MTIQKDCADHLRSTYTTGSSKLRAGHAHEIVASYFGYGTAAALQAESAYPLAALDEASVLIPAIPLMEQRMQQLKGLPTNLPGADELAKRLSAYLVQHNHFSGQVWHTHKLEEFIEEEFIQDHSLAIMDDLSGEMAETNAYFDELYVEQVTISEAPESVVATVSGHLNGENDPDKPFSGDSIAFTTTVTLERVAGRTAFLSPELDSGGTVDDKDYYDPEPPDDEAKPSSP
ncbi:MAG: hypothetical protein BGN99_24775 [Alphaproteobacteria bacterium 65-37]|jgi:hypothetical protein|uniref:hypothetical protein n=1 Tax=uncultured Reyranella sp. TaxID=735512 RepID=UPI000959AEA4|nr:hypothetical protein [uncultured Reyranella sp.]OJU34984.1 MAG: hypothetical protein BGN99_24775 [Alphaproteobacteria bacterium 65-37]